MNVDRQYRIRIDLVTDATGARDAKQALAETGAAAEAGARGIDQNKEATDRLNVSHHDLRAIMHGIGREFPELGHLGMMAVHPIGLAAAAAAAAFKIWQARIEAVEEALGGKLDLPAGSAFEPGHVSALADEWKKYGDAMREAFDKLTGIDAETKKVLDNIDQALKRQIELNAAQKAQEDSARKVAEAKATAAGQPTAGLKLTGIEADAAAAAAKDAEERGAKMAKLAIEAQEAEDLKADAEAKAKAATDIHVMSLADEAKQLADLQKQAEAAKKEREAAMAVETALGARQADAQKMREREALFAPIPGETQEAAVARRLGAPSITPEGAAGGAADRYSGLTSRLGAFWLNFKQLATGMSDEEFAKAQQDRIDRAKIAEDAARTFAQSIPGAAQARAERARLLKQAEDEQTKAGEIGAKLPGAQANLDADAQASQIRLLREHITALNNALAEGVADLASKRREAASQVTQHEPITPLLLKQIQQDIEFQNAVTEKIRNLETNLAHLRSNP